MTDADRTRGRVVSWWLPKRAARSSAARFVGSAASCFVMLSLGALPGCELATNVAAHVLVDELTHAPREAPREDAPDDLDITASELLADDERPSP